MGADCTIDGMLTVSAGDGWQGGGAAISIWRMSTASDYATPDAWRRDAMRRPSAIDAAESDRRRQVAVAHNRSQGNVDADTLADQQLYIQGKMDIEEYQRYLLFKHGRS